MTSLTFLEQFQSRYKWPAYPAKRVFRYLKQVNKGMIEEHRLALTLGGVIDRALDDVEGLQSSDYTTYQIFEKDDLVFKLIDLENIKTSRVGHVPRRGIMSPAYIRLTRMSKNALPRYYYWLFYAAYLNNIFNGMGGGVRQNLTPTDLLEFPIPQTPQQEQKEIADFLDRETSRIDQLINKKMRLIGVIEEKKAILINKTVREGIYPQEMNEPNLPWLKKIPKHWKIERLRHIGELQNGISEGAEYFGSGHPFVGYGDVYKNFSLPKELSGLAKSSSSDQARYSVKRGDIFFTRTSEVAEEIGFSSVCLDTIEKATFSGFLIRFRPIRDALLPEYSQYYFRSDIPRFFFIKEMNLVTRVSLGQNLLKNLPILIPPLDEQKTLALYLDEHTKKIDQIINKENISIEKLKEMKSSLITQAVTGQLDIHAWQKRGMSDRWLDKTEQDMNEGARAAC